VALVGLLAFGTAAGLLLCELLLRAAGYTPEFVNPLGAFHRGHPRLGYLGKPDLVARFHTTEFDVEIVHDDRGFRRQEHQNPRSATQPTVYVLGDSFTWGWGVAQGEVYTDRLSELLPRQRLDNLGVSGAGTAVQFEIFDLFAREDLAPGDVVVLRFSSNDFRDNVEGWAHGVVGPDGSVRYAVSEMGKSGWDPRQRSCLFNLLAFEWNYRRSVREAAEQQRQVSHRAQLDPEMIAVTRHYLAAFRDAAAEADARFLLMRVPSPREFGEREADVVGDANAHVYRDALYEVAGELDIELLDLLPVFLEAQRERPESRLSFVDDAHWNPNGHELVARALAERLGPPSGLGGS
jgi:lysophospholipase L1-like esterase